jgi:hypothetical protein
MKEYTFLHILWLANSPLSSCLGQLGAHFNVIRDVLLLYPIVVLFRATLPCAARNKTGHCASLLCSPTTSRQN